MPISASVFKWESRKQSKQWRVTRENGNIGSKQKVQTHSPGKIFKQETWETLLIMMNSAYHYCTLCSQLAEVRIILVPMSFARLSALCIIVKKSKIWVRFLKFKFLKLISITTVFLVIMLKLTKFHGIKGNNSFQLQHFFDKHMVFGCKSIKH